MGAALDPLSWPRVVNPLRWFEARRAAPAPLVLYSKPGCGLCDEMKAQIARARLSRRIEFTEIDIERDAQLLERFGRSIPVLEICGRVAFKGRMSAQEFEQKFERLAREWSSGAPCASEQER